MALVAPGLPHDGLLPFGGPLPQTSCLPILHTCHLRTSTRLFRPVISPLTVIASVLPVYILMAAGALLRKTGVVRKEHDAGVMQLVYMVMLPCFMLDKMLGSDVLRNPWTVLSGAGIGFSLIIIGIGIGFIVARLFGLAHGTGMRTLALTAGTQNFGFTAAPVVEILWGTSTLAMLFVHNTGVELAMWTVGVMIMSSGSTMQWKKLINGPVVAVAVGLLLVFTGLDDSITGPVRRAMSMIGVGAFPLGILIIGCTIMDLIGTERPSLRVISAALLVRLCLAPLAILSAAKFLPIATELKQVLVVQAAMPAAITPIMLARMYGGRPAVAVQVVVFTTVASLLTVPWIITWGCQWIGLNPQIP